MLLIYLLHLERTLCFFSCCSDCVRDNVNVPVKLLEHLFHNLRYRIRRTNSDRGTFDLIPKKKSSCDNKHGVFGEPERFKA